MAKAETTAAADKAEPKKSATTAKAAEAKTAAPKSSKPETKAEDKPKAAPKPIVTKVKLPELQEFLKAGVQFGHETKRWNPKFGRYIFASKKGIHVIDLSQTLPLLQLAGDVLAQKSQEGPIVFLGTKRQASGIIEKAAQEIGVHFITNRWAGGFLSNFDQIKTSLKRLQSLETQFEQGITGRTKYEISQMKKDWERLDRLYGGVKYLDQLPAAVFVIDPGFEAGAIRECNQLNIPVVAMVDSNTDPSMIDYPIPANDDAIGSIELVMNYIAERLKEVDSIFKVKHQFKDYLHMEVEIKRAASEDAEEKVMVDSASVEGKARPAAARKAAPSKSAKAEAKTTKTAAEPKKAKDAEATGILSKYQDKKQKAIKPRK